MSCEHNIIVIIVSTNVAESDIQNAEGGHHGNGPKSIGIFGNLLKANYVMTLLLTFRTFYWIFKLHEYLVLN